MIAIITGWVVISFVLLSFGDMFIRLYTKFCKNEESYGILDTFILGLCAVTVLLSFTSLWLPSNQYMLFVYILLSLIYWICNRRVLMSHINHVKNILKSLSFLQKSLLFIVMASVFFYMLFSAFSGDAGFYHHQNIRWNEEYRVVPGLANFEDRYGFNSSYMLLSAIFTFRFIFGEAVYMLQSLLFVLILCWIMVNLFRSKYDFRYLLMLFLMFYALMWGGYMIADTNTDSIPLLCTFYFLSKTAINPDWLKKQPLMAFLLPVTLVTFKVSMAIFCLVSLGVLIYLIRQKKNRSVCFLLSASVFTIVLWCIRNVIISGYLVYPMYNIDLFDFDWKVPVGTAALQKMYIYDWAKIAFESFYINSIERLYSGHKFDFINNVVNLILFLYIVVSPFIVIYNILKKKKIDIRILYVYLVSLACIAFCMLSAPDFRFVNGYIFGCIILLGTIISPSKLRLKAGKGLAIALSVCFIIFIGWHTRRITIVWGKLSGEHMQSTLFYPLHPPYEPIVEEYQMGNFSVYVIGDGGYCNFGMLPVTIAKGLPFTPFHGQKIQDIHTIEARGSSIQDGFRTKPEYIEIMNKNTQKYIEEYSRIYKKKYPLGYFDRVK